MERFRERMKNSKKYGSNFNKYNKLSANAKQRANDLAYNEENDISRPDYAAGISSRALVRR